ncbi:MAG: 2-hydroxyacid dehydrogenase [Betaproteobacteria bacterium]
MRIFFTGQLEPAEAQAWQEALRSAAPGHEWIVHAAEGAEAGVVHADVAVVANPPPGSLSRVRGLRLIQSLWAGVDRLMADATVPAQVPLARMVDPAMTSAMVQSALWAVTALHRGFFTYARQQQQAHWVQHLQRRAAEVKVLVLGLGTMGAAVSAALATQGYEVTAWRRRDAAPGSSGVTVLHGAQGLEAGLAAAEVVLNLLPLTPHTRGLIDAGFLGRMKAGAALVNFGRGGHVVEADLLAALSAGRLAHAVLDVFATEPLPASHPFWQHPCVTVLPHVAALTDLRSAADVVASNLARLQAGQPPLHLVEWARGY